ncbi:hypothetical protein Z043_101332 [Scleropages formosus]|uniref:Porphobilinogen deaminase C-terminal domain-containing protein n=1 Tax=Scleropages formosus TaxID=113540 RepID=A0A0P7VA50_SCLFO|nr:hypothetical protein Z043_101332 [Scleropages formosus]
MLYFPFLSQEGGCSVPVAIHSEVKESQLYLTGAVYSLDGLDSLKETMQTSFTTENQNDSAAVYGYETGIYGCNSLYCSIRLSAYIYFGVNLSRTLVLLCKVEERVHVGITARTVLPSAQDAAEKLGTDLAALLLHKGAKKILSVARQLNNAR